MKKVLLFLLALLPLAAFAGDHATVIGKVNMLSSKNVSFSEHYVLLSTDVSTGDKTIKHSRAKTVQEALDNTVRSIPGGVFVMNARIYLVKGKYFAVSGDVWGLKTNVSADFKGFHIGDNVTWKALTPNQWNKGTIEAFKKDDFCLIKMADGSIRKVKISRLSKLE